MKRFLAVLLIFSVMQSSGIFRKTSAVTVCVLGEISLESEYLYADANFLGIVNKKSLKKRYDKAITEGADNAQALNSVISGLGTAIQNMILNLNTEVVEPYAEYIGDGKFVFHEGSAGGRIDEEGLYCDIYNSLGEKRICVIAEVIEEKPQKNIDEIKANTVKISSFSTNYSSSSATRKSNIKLAASKLNGLILYDKTEFSFNTAVGARSVENGFLEAPIIVGGQFTSGIGGGVCQVSTTLYNAALLAGLTVTEVNQHSLAVGYVEPSFDAMVSSVSDLKFVNNSGYPLYISASADGTVLKITLYGAPVPNGMIIKRQSETVKIIAFDTIEELEPTLETDTVEILSHGKDGLVSRGYLLYYKNGALIYKRLLRKNTYKPISQIQKRGTGEYIIKDDNIADPEGVCKEGDMDIVDRFERENAIFGQGEWAA